MADTKRVPLRSEVQTADTWDLSNLFPSDAAWDTTFTAWEKELDKYQKFQGTLANGAQAIAACLDFDNEFDRAGERLGTYAHLKTTEDVANSAYQAMLARFQNAASRAMQASSYIRPELMAIPAARMDEFLASPALAPHKLSLERILRYRKHTLTPGEERLLAMQTEMAGAAGHIFRQLNNADLKFGELPNEKGDMVELSHGTFSAYLHNADRDFRKRAFEQYYREFSDHQNTIAASLNGSIQADIYYARARNYPSALESALFSDNVPISVYDNLIASVHRNLPAVHKYYDVRRRAMKLDDIHQYDTYVPILSEMEVHYPWDKAVELVLDSLHPLGKDYRDVLTAGLKGRWCDKYENKGKQSGAFSSGSYDGWPYILMNYQPTVLDHVFTLTHEAGHSMHSYYSAKHQPYQYYNYTIFVAEVASTFNEQLLSRHLQAQAKSDRERAYLINREIDAIRGTLVRQTMFAEFEKISHALVEANEPLTVERIQKEYRKLLDRYFGPKFVIDQQLELECLRIPHFYRAFYVYKYATGISAAIALSEKVAGGGPGDLNAYLTFLKGGCSKFPLDLLRDAGVDLEQPGPVDMALARFSRLVDELESLVL